MYVDMVKGEPCVHSGCSGFAVTLRETCSEHLQDLEGYLSELAELVQSTQLHFGLSLQGLKLGGIDLSSRKLHSCNFSGAQMNGADISGTEIHLSRLDWCHLDSCSFQNSRISYSIFTGSNLTKCNFSYSTILHVNLNGVRGEHLTMDNANIYYSTEEGARWIESSFEDCTITR